jgi:hypothetical protein
VLIGLTVCCLMLTVGWCFTLIFILIFYHLGMGVAVAMSTAALISGVLTGVVQEDENVGVDTSKYLLDDVLCPPPGLAVEPRANLRHG